MTLKLKRPNRLCYSLPVLLLVAVAGGLLITGMSCSKIELQHDPQEISLLQSVFPDAYGYNTRNDIFTVYDDKNDKLGYAFTATGNGYSGEIRIMVGLEDSETIKNIYVLAHNEVLNMGGDGGDDLDFSPLIAQLSGLKISNCYLTRDGGEVDVITGATTSSRAVVNIVREAVNEAAEYLN